MIAPWSHIRLGKVRRSSRVPPTENTPVKSTIAVAALLCAAFAADAQTLADVKKRGALRIGYSETSVPFSFKDKDGQPSG